MLAIGTVLDHCVVLTVNACLKVSMQRKVGVTLFASCDVIILVLSTVGCCMNTCLLINLWLICASAAVDVTILVY